MRTYGLRIKTYQQSASSVLNPHIRIMTVTKSKKDKKVVIVMPAYNAEETLKKTYLSIPKDWVDEIILVDDASNDRTVEIAKELGIKTFIHLRNRGYGANQKTCYTEALKTNSDIIIMLHPDYQYDPKYIPDMITPIKNNHFDIVLGSRITSRKKVLAGGMPIYKYIANRFLTLVENIVLGLSLSEYHTGYRAYSRRALEIIPFLNNSDDFVFDSEFLIQAAYYNLRISEIFVPTRYFSEASSINFYRSLIYGLATLWTLFKYILARIKLYQFKIFRKK